MSILIGSAATVISCGSLAYWLHTQTSDTVPISNRHRHLITSPEYEASLGRISYNQISRNLKILPPNHPASITVKAVGQRLLSSVDAPALKRPWKFVAVSDKSQPNAFALPPGYVVIYSGMFKYVRTESELAAVMAHEIGHVVARHTGEKVTEASLANLTTLGLSALSSLVFGGDGGRILSVGNKLLYELPNSRDMEREADKIGVELMGRACFDPLSASSVFVRMEEDDKKKGGGGSSSSYLSTHPGHGERVGNLRKWGREVKGKMKGREGECAEINRRWEEMRRGKRLNN